MERTSRMITLLRKEEKSKKNKTKKKNNLETHEMRPITMSEVLEMISFPRQHFRVGFPSTRKQTASAESTC